MKYYRLGVETGNLGDEVFDTYGQFDNEEEALEAAEDNMRSQISSNCYELDDDELGDAHYEGFIQLNDEELERLGWIEEEGDFDEV